jgi:hypothetical protein
VTTTNVFASTINVTGNIYASNAITTTNLTCAGFTSNISNTIFNYSTLTVPFVNCTTLNVYSASNVLTLSIPGSTGQTSINVTGNAYVSNALSTTNVFVSNGLDVGPGTLGSNVVVFSNISGGANTFVMDSNGRVTIGSTYSGGSLLSFGQNVVNKILTLYDINSADNPVSATNFYGFGINGNILRYQVPNSTTDRHVFFGGSAEYARITNTGMSIAAGSSGGGSLLSFGQNSGNKMITLYDVNSVDNPATATNFFGLGINNGTLRYQVPNSTIDRHVFFGGSTEYARITGTGISILTGAAPTSSLQVTGNAYISNALTTTNVFANTLTMTSNATSTINVTGNIYASNAVTTTNLFTAGITSNVTSTIFNSDTLTIPFMYSTTLNVASTSNLDVVTITGEPGLTSLNVTGNIYASNAITTTNVFTNGRVGIGTTNPRAQLHVSGIVATNVNAYNYYNYTFPTPGVYYVVLEYNMFSDTNIIDGWNVCVGGSNNPHVTKIAGTGNFLRALVVSQFVVGFGSANSLPANYNNSTYNLRVALLCAQ